MRILLVEDDEVLLTVVSRSLKDSGHRVDVAKTLADARYLWTVQPFDAVLLDLNLPLLSEAGSKMGTGLVALILLVLMAWSRNPLNFPGLFEHLATAVLSLWIFVFAVRLMRSSEHRFPIH